MSSARLPALLLALAAGTARADTADLDGDGFDSGELGGGDCDDQDAATHPGALEVCGDDRDQDCSGADLACPAASDTDGDGYGRATEGGTDCDDWDSAVHPGATELCGTGRDENCDGLDPACSSQDDVDEDGYRGFARPGEACQRCNDCDDLDAALHPGARERCDDGVDQDCDGRDASVTVDAICDDDTTTDPAFDGVRPGAAPLTTPAEPSGCRTSPDARAWPALGWVLARLARRRRPRC